MIYLRGDFSFDDPPPLSVAVDNLLSLWIGYSSFPSHLLIQVPAFTLKKKLLKIKYVFLQNIMILRLRNSLYICDDRDFIQRAKRSHWERKAEQITKAS